MRNTGKKIMALVMMMVLLMTSAVSIPAMAEKSAAKPTKIKITGVKKLEIGKSIDLDAKVMPANASQKVTWKSSDKKIATVNSNGKVEGKKAGKVTITATSKANSKVKASVKITVTAPKAKSVEITAKTKTLDLWKQKTITLKAKASPASAAQSFTWKSSNSKVATVSSKGKVTAVSTGVATITATAKDGSKKRTRSGLK